MRYARLSAQVDEAAYPCRVQGACAPHCSRRRNSPTDGAGAVPPTPRRGRGTRVGSSQSTVQHDRFATVSWRDRPVANAHGSQPPADRGAIRGVAVTDEVARCLIPWECFGDLAGDPLGGWIWRHIGPDELSPLQTQDDQPVEQFEPDRRNDEQIDAGDVGGVIAQENLPTRRARAMTP